LKITALNQAGDVKEFPFLRHCLAIFGFFIVFYTLWFLPSLLGGELLGPGDGYLQSLPAYYAPRTLWTTQLLGGFPVAADVTPQTWYPLSILLSLLPHSWNAFVISSYVLASAFTYAYVYVITRSTLAGLVSGLTYGCSGFMMAHLGHISMIHTATWIPLTLLTCEQLLRSNRKIWLLLLAFAVACLFLAGHPQISVYGLGLVIAYAAFFGALSPTRWKFYGLFSIAILTGLGLAAIQLIPTAELAKMTPRAEMSFQDFLAFSMPLSHAVMAIFPFIFGGGEIFPYRLPYIGISGLTEIPIYMGLLPLSLAWVGGRTNHYSKFFRYFWVTVALISFVLMLGATTPMAWISFQVPGYNKFRIPSRHGIELAMAVSIMAGLGIKTIQQPHWESQNLKKMLWLSVLSIGLLTLWAVVVCLYFLQEKNLITSQITVPFLSAAILPSLAIFVLGWVGLVSYVRKRSTATFIGLLVVLTIDLSAFGWFYGWQNSPTAAEILPTPPFLKKYNPTLEQQHQRFFPVKGGYAKPSEAPPNLSRIWDSPNMSGYGPLLISQVGQLMSLTPFGSLSSNSSLFDSQDRSFDLAAVRYITTSKPTISPLISDVVTKWSQEDLALSMGNVCVLEPRNEITIDLADPLLIDSINLVGTLGCSNAIVQGANVLEVVASDNNGLSESHFLKAGQDMSELSILCPESAAQVKHKAAKVFQQISDASKACPGNLYVAKVPLMRASVVRQLKLRLPVENIGSVSIVKISLNNSLTKTSSPFLGGRWKYVEDLGEVRIYENLNVMPRAWLTSQVQSAQPAQILAAVKTSKLPNGEIFNPRSTALIEEPIDFAAQTPDPNATVQVEVPTETQVRLQTHSSQPSFLVLSDVFYPGWEAHIDGKPAHIFQTNYIFRGLQLPPGDHTVSFSFRPKSFAIGCGIAGASFALLLYLVIADRRSSQTSSTPTSSTHHESV
jgi:Bacterial membrane protein YfhO